MIYLSILCHRCKKQIGSARHVVFRNDENGLAYYYHALSLNDCWTRTLQDVQVESWSAILKAKRGNYAT